MTGKGHRKRNVWKRPPEQKIVKNVSIHHSSTQIGIFENDLISNNPLSPGLRMLHCHHTWFEDVFHVLLTKLSMLDKRFNSGTTLEMLCFFVYLISDGSRQSRNSEARGRFIKPWIRFISQFIRYFENWALEPGYISTSNIRSEALLLRAVNCKEVGCMVRYLWTKRWF